MKKRLPWDVFAVGIVELATAGLGLLSALGHLSSPSEPVTRYAYVALFGLVRLRSSLWIGVDELLGGGALLVAGYGLIKGRAYGWWLSMGLVIMRGIPASLANLAMGPVIAISLGSACIVLVWGLFRIKLFRPFGRGKEGPTWTPPPPAMPDASDPPETDADTEA